MALLWVFSAVLFVFDCPMGSFGSPFGFIFMFRSKRKKFLISFVSLLSVLFIVSIFPASAATVYKFSIAQPQISSNSCFLEVVFSSGKTFVIYAGLSTPNNMDPDFPDINPVDSAVFIADVYSSSGTNYLRIRPYYGDSSPVAGVIIVGYYCDRAGHIGSLNQSNDYSQVSFYMGSVGDIVSIHGYNCSVAGLPVTLDFTFSYGNDNILNDKLDDILEALQEQIGEDYKPSQPDPGISSGIGSVESGESSIISGAEGDYNSQITAGNNTVLSFFKSAGNSLSFVRTLFYNLVSDKIYILVIASIMLAILPVLINAAGGFRK